MRCKRRPDNAPSCYSGLFVTHCLATAEPRPTNLYALKRSTVDGVFRRTSSPGLTSVYKIELPARAGTVLYLSRESILVRNVPRRDPDSKRGLSRSRPL